MREGTASTEGSAGEAAAFRPGGDFLCSAVLDAAPDAMVVVDPSATVRRVNGAFRELTGWVDDSGVGQSLGVILRLPSGDLGWASLWTRLERGECWRDEGQLQRADGTTCTAERAFSPVRDASDRVTHALVVLRDITVRRELELELKRLGDAQGRELEAVRSTLAGVTRDLEMFAYAVSHDLRAPLRAIDFFGRELVDHAGTALDSEARGYLERVFAARRRMVQIIDGMMGLFHIGRGELRWADLDLSAMAEDVVGELRRTQPGRAVSVTVHSGLRARGDFRLVQAILASLLDNAWKFTGRKADARIEVGGLDRDGGRVFYVRDNGAGFNVAYADRLFTTIRRLHTQEEYEGCGIGLVSVHRALQRHHGRIWVEAAEGVGATFFFELGKGPVPLKPAVPAPAR